MYFITEPKRIEQRAFTTPKQIITKPILFTPRAHATYAWVKSAPMKACSMPINTVMGMRSCRLGFFI